VVTFVDPNPPGQQRIHGIAKGNEVATVIRQVVYMYEFHIAHAQGRARHSNLIHPADEATGQVDTTHPAQRDAMEGAIAGHAQDLYQSMR
jgi:hypothetical protein